MSDSKLVLIVDDEPGILSTLSGVLSDEGYDTVCTGSGSEALDLYGRESPDVVMLDVWLPDHDGLETLQALREFDPAAAVIMMSGHGTASTAVKAIKMGACDYVEKPLSYNQTLEAVEGALDYRASISSDRELLTSLEKTKDRLETPRDLTPPPTFGLVQRTDIPQKTIARSTVIYGLGLHSGSRTGMAIQPLPADSGIHFVILPTNTHVPAYVGAVAETDYATTLATNGESIKTVEHFLSAAHALGVTQSPGEGARRDPGARRLGSRVLQGDSRKPASRVQESRPAASWWWTAEYEVVRDGRVSALPSSPTTASRVSYLLRYPPPIGEQRYEFELDSFEGRLQEGDRPRPNLRLHEAISR